MTHYWGSNYDWCSVDERRRWQSMTGTQATLDFDNKGGKTIYDPCPIGYRVPTGSSNLAQGTWGDFNTTNFPWQNGGTITAGSLFTKGTTSWYPASGLRVSSSGALYYVATDGYSWSASPCLDSSNARYLDFLSTLVRPSYSNYRSWGFPVRCVQE